MALKCHLVVFARLPRLGAGKRRLAKGVGAVEALRFQRTMLGITLRRLSGDGRWITWLAMTPTPTPRRARQLGGRIIPQGRGSLGDRMAAVARAMPPGPVVIVGSDIPGISAASVAAAFRLLGSRDAVFGPALDGGYWLVGLRRRPRFIAPFNGVRWSSQHALEDTLANLPGYRVGFVQTLEDVDNATALKRHLPTLGTFAHRIRIASDRASTVDQTCPAPSP